MSPNDLHIALVAGAGRNSGKTSFACRLIEQVSEIKPVTGLKISAKMHEIAEQAAIIYQSSELLIIRENNATSSKDSSRFLRAGAIESFFVCAADEQLVKAFKILRKHIASTYIVCESGGLHTYLSPELFFLIHRDEIPRNKRHYLDYNPIIVKFGEKGFNFKFEAIGINNSKFVFPST